MRKISEAQALVQLRRRKQQFAAYIAQNYGEKALDCRQCSTICCANDKFVNVNITRLEAIAIWRTLKNSPRITPQLFEKILTRVTAAIEQYRLSPYGDTFLQTYACPLFEKGIGCLVHWKAKPGPCIQHGCYQDWQDLPDTEAFSRVEQKVEKLNKTVYHQDWQYATIPVWLSRIANEVKEKMLCEDEVD
jgi:hypothetical protein